MENRIVVQLSRLFRARFPYIYITTWEEERAISLIKKISKSENKTDGVTRDGLISNPLTTKGVDRLAIGL